jgi:hypothetical protein
MSQSKAAMGGKTTRVNQDNDVDFTELEETDDDKKLDRLGAYAVCR